jgi:acyl transferase domain-containing protein/acyl carrier protein
VTFVSKHWSAPDGPWRGKGIAIIGMAGRFPQAESVDAFWRNLRDGRDCIARLTRQELLADGVSPDLLDHERFVPAGGVLGDIELFDASFFGISPREAESMDPQQRIFLEVVQHAFDDAGLDPARAPGPIAVYAGCRLSGYWLRLMRLPEFMASVGWHQVAAGNDKDFLPTQASFRFDLRGPSINVQAACSTSLLAVALGCDALLDARCDVAVAGAASIAVPQRTGYMYQPSSIASPDGKCRPFDAGANGSVLGNGVAAVVLKRVDDAIAAGDRIYAVIRSIAVNNDGSTKSSFAGPSVKAQAEVIANAVQRAGIAPQQIGYVEAHGTATTLGDPIEIAALARVLANGAPRPSPCGIGSVKSNIGHLDPAAGVASLIKAALCLHEEEIPASLHFERPNPAIDFAAAGVRVVVEREAWPRCATPRYAGVSAFGIGGTNVHAVLEEAPAVERRASDHRPELLVLSAKSPDALRAMAAEVASWLRACADQPLADAVFTLACGRREFNHRRIVVAETPDQAADQLDQPDTTARRFLRDRRVVFLFPGQGSQQLRMGMTLYRAEPVFRAAVDEVFALAESFLGFDARCLVDPGTHGNGEQRDVAQTAVAQPLLFAVAIAAARLWRHWGVQPQHMLGHSVGELAAAHLAGVLSLPDAVRVVCERGRLMQSMPPGAMLAVSLSEAEALALEDADLRVAAFNAPRQHTISGSIPAIAALEERLRESGVEFSRLGTSHAFHHGSMREAAAGLLETLRDVRLSPPTLPFVSCVSGLTITAEQATSPDYWAESIVAPVRFSSGVMTLLDAPDTVFIECGAGRALGSLLRAHRAAPDVVVLGTMAARGDSRSDHVCALDALGQAWQIGVGVEWEALWRERPKRRINLPGYPFQRQRHWIDAPAEPAAVRVACREAADKGYTRVWTPAPLSAPAATPPPATWLVLADTGGPAAALCERLRQDGERAVAMLAADDARQLSDHEFRVDPRSAEAIRQLVDQLAIAPGPVHVVNAWTAAVPPGPLTVQRAEAGALLGFWAPLRLLRALAAAGRPATALSTLTSRLFPIARGELAEPAIAPAIGLTRVLPQEVAGLRVRIVDALPPTSAHEAQVLIEQIVAELRSSAAEPIIAYRSGTRLCESFAPLPLPPTAPGKVVLPGATYLITGGFGGIGGVLARVLASVGQVRLVLVGRRGLGSGSAESANGARQRVHELEAMGAAVLPLAADVADPQQMAGVVNEVQSRFGRIAGVVHAAGVPGGRMLMLPEDDAAGSVLAPKLHGTIALLDSVAPHQPDFVLMCSSFAAVAGGLGQGEYSAGNAFVDAAAWYARALGLRATAVDWPAWRDVGMAHAVSLPPELDHLRQASLDSGITPEEGADLFARIIAADLPQVVVAPFADAATAPARMPQSATPASVQTRPEEARRAAYPATASVPAPSTEDVLAERIGGMWSNVLGVPEVRPSDNFFELGGQSLMALQIVLRVGEQFAVELNLTEVFERPTLAEFSALVHQRMVESIEALPKERVQELLAET